LTAYRVDVPDGDYEVELLFAEPDAKPGERVFSLSVNGKDVATNLDLSAKYGIAWAASVKADAAAANGTGLVIGFKPIRGKPILNAIRLRKK
ncbi:MAG: malectin domain-containing carbohydrate-binding protein, partial [Gemmatimonadaceae bacterium]